MLGGQSDSPFYDNISTEVSDFKKYPVPGGKDNIKKLEQKKNAMIKVVM